VAFAHGRVSGDVVGSSRKRDVSRSLVKQNARVGLKRLHAQSVGLERDYLDDGKLKIRFIKNLCLVSVTTLVNSIVFEGQYKIPNTGTSSQFQDKLTRAGFTLFSYPNNF
jgi:hypothetical protein